MSRWGYLNRMMKRQALLEGAGGLLTSILDEVKVVLSVDYSLEQHLTALLQADKDNFTVRNKLKVLKICRAMLRPLALLEMVVTVVGHGIVDQIHHSILGNKQMNQASLVDLLDPKTSAIEKAQKALLDAMKSFSPTNPTWLLAHLLGIEFFSRSTKLHVRKSLGRLAAGVNFYFEVFLSQDFWCLVVVLPRLGASLSRNEQLQHLQRFYNASKLCLSLAGQRLRDDYPTAEDALVRCRPWAETFFTKPGIADTAFVERMHAACRQSVKSQTRSRGFNEAADRLYCKQVGALHASQGGANSSRLPLPIRYVDSSSTEEQRLTKHKCNPQILFRNMKLHAYKAVHGLGRSLTPGEIADVYAKADDEYDQYCRDPGQKPLLDDLLKGWWCTGARSPKNCNCRE